MYSIWTGLAQMLRFQILETQLYFAAQIGGFRFSDEKHQSMYKAGYTTQKSMLDFKDSKFLGIRVWFQNLIWFMDMVR